ncbi:hypothetical protein AYK26_01135 [Euryarchaeota archaeon SM23-78]|nr:MAG: hypothetical protein AYK26_01135 [Euryarchaeota archaeon SM23-78]MBW3001222.1 hypothetical protein [Candidatus Woesearchaeota archaeon]
MKIAGSKVKSSRKSLITKEFLTGLLALALGVYNLLAHFGYITKFVEVPQLIGNILLVLAGLFLWITAFRLSRFRYHSRRLF